ncbi:MAG: hypothetical protein ACOC2F_07520 [Bacteroidota bacterium]
MWFKAIILFVIFLTINNHPSKAQNNDTIVIQRNDTIIKLIQPGEETEKKLEGRRLEEILENYSDRNLFSRKLHEWLVKSNIEDSTSSHSDRIQDDFSEYNNSTIANIDIRHIDPFGGSVNDTASISESWLAKVGNHLRFESTSSAILKTITFKRNAVLDQTDLYDSERMLRGLSFINDARIIVWPSNTNNNEVNISIYVQDRYPHAISAGMINDQPRITLINKNLMGRAISLSHTLVTPAPGINNWGFRETLGANNFLGKYINFDLDYSNIKKAHFLSGRIERNFILPTIKYAGGINLNRSFTNKSLRDFPAVVWEPPLSYRRQNLWVGRSIMIGKENSPLRSNLYFMTRFMDLQVFDIPEEANYIREGEYYYGKIAYSRRGYYKNNLIHSFGRTEDVPYGTLSSLSFGYHSGLQSRRKFLGLHYSTGKALIPSNGYLYFCGDIGSFFSKEGPRQGYLKLTTQYITPLIQLNKNDLRSFFEVNYVKGFNRLPGEYLIIDEDVNGLHRFDYSRKIRGAEKFVLKTEQVLFTSIEPLGFKFAAFSFFDMAFLNENTRKTLFRHSPYFSFGGGLRIRNDNLVFNTLQIRLAIMPRVPSGELPLSLRITGENVGNFRDFIPQQPGSPVFY